MAQAPGGQEKIRDVLERNLAFMREYLKDKLEVCHVKLNLTPEALGVVYREMLENYENCVGLVCPGITAKGLELKSLTQPDLHAVWGAIEQRLPLPGYLIMNPPSTWTTNPYTHLKKSPGGATEKWIKLHRSIVHNLLHYARIDPNQLSEILHLSYWVFGFYSKKEEKKHACSKIAHYFHSDLVVTFIALKAHYSTFGNSIPTCNFILPTSLPEFKHDIMCYGVTAEHSAFQRLILLNVLKILGVERHMKDLTRLSPEQLAALVYHHFKGDGLSWSAKGVEGVLRIVMDQSRYMSVRSPHLRRNYVADKTRCHISAMIKHYVLSVPLEDERDWEALSISIAVVRQWDIRDDGAFLPPNPERPPNKKIINSLHHRILHEICFKVLGRERCPHIDKDGWFEDIKFIPYIIEVASLVVNIARQPRSRSEKTRLYHDLGDIINYLQYIIAARWYVSECYLCGMAPTKLKETLDHHNVLFLFIAFRVLMLYLLPQNPCHYDVQKVADILPKYARVQEFAFPLQKLFEAFDR